MAEANPVGRPSRFTAEMRESILHRIRQGIPYQLAAECNGITEGTLYEWLRKGVQDSQDEIESDYAQFSKDIKIIIAEKAALNLEKIQAGSDKWQANAWLLERSPTTRKHFNANGDALEKLSEQIAAMEAKIEAKNNG